jgi:hypothetical protein
MERNKGNIAFLIGNGINIYDRDGENNNWLSILQDLWNEYTDLRSENLNFPGKPGKIDISYTELYDVIKTHLKHEYHDQPGVILGKTVSDMEKWLPKAHHKEIIEKIKALDAPVLTTNFDNNLSTAAGAKFIKMPKGREGFSHQYPWQCYYAAREVRDNRKNFAVWNIHGNIRYKQSIKLGLSDYMGMVHTAKRIISDKLYTCREQPSWGGAKTWLNIFFYNSLFIFGLGLSREEIFLRWLLNERHKFLNMFMDKCNIERNAWYVHVAEEGEIDYGKSLFFKSLDIGILTVPTYKDLYETLWR